MALSNAERQKRWREKRKRRERQGDQNALVEKLRRLYDERAAQFRRRYPDRGELTAEDFLRSRLAEDADPFFVSVLMEMLTGSPGVPASFRGRILERD